MVQPNRLLRVEDFQRAFYDYEADDSLVFGYRSGSQNQYHDNGIKECYPTTGDPASHMTTLEVFTGGSL